jgi:hypothetical protein
VTESQDAWLELLVTLAEVGDRFAGEEWGLTDPTDVAEGLRVILHHLGTGIETQLEQDAAHPTLRPITTPWRKALGDNADAIYHDARIDPRGTYRLRGRTAGATYVSITVEAGAEEGAFPTGTVGVLNDTRFDVADDGSFEVTLGGPSPGGDERGWLPLAADASRLTLRHYWEAAEPPATPPAPDLGLAIELVAGDVPAAPPAPTDASVAASIRRMATYLRGRTLENIAKPGEGEPPAFVSRVPHEFPAPTLPGTHALAAADYSMAPYLLGPDDALVMTLSAWPECRLASVSLWNRQMQTFDYLRGRVSLNRAQAVPSPDRSIRIVLAHRDPGVANWLTTEGRPFGLLFWRFFLADGPIATPTAQVVPVDSL